MTREERNAYQNAWYHKNKIRVNEILRNKTKTQEQKASHKLASNKYYYANKEKCKESSLRSKELHGEKWREKARNNPELKARKRLQYSLNIEESRSKDRARYLSRKSKLQEYNERNKIDRNKKYLIRIKKRKESDPLFKLSRNVPTLIRTSVKRCGFSKHSKTYQILGCTFEEFKTHIESKLETWMNWDNYGKYNGSIGYGWEFDHIIPVSSATSEEEIIRLNHYTNLQPLDSFINRYVKRNKAA